MKKLEIMIVSKGCYGVKVLKMVPYICTVPGGGVRAITCYPDAQTYIVNGNHVGYSPSKQTLLVTFGCPPARAIRAFMGMGNFIFAPEILKKYGIESPKNDKSITEN